MTVARLAVMIHLTLDGHLLCMCSHENPNLSLGGIGIHDSSDLNIFWASWYLMIQIVLLISLALQLLNILHMIVSLILRHVCIDTTCWIVFWPACVPYLLKVVDIYGYSFGNTGDFVGRGLGRRAVDGFHANGCYCTRLIWLHGLRIIWLKRHRRLIRIFSNRLICRRTDRISGRLRRLWHLDLMLRKLILQILIIAKCHLWDLRVVQHYYLASILFKYYSNYS